MGSVVSIEVAPLQWSEWHVYGSEEYTMKGRGREQPNPHMITDTNGWPYHKLIELGRTTNTYQYKVYGMARGRVLLYKTIHLPCCSMLKYCPLGRYGEPPMMELCREHLRAQATGEAYQLWVAFMKKLAGGR